MLGVGFFSSFLFIIFHEVVLEKAKDVVENIVTAGLLCQEEGLDKLLSDSSSIRHLAEDLDHETAVERGLAINVLDQDLTVLKTELDNLLANGLRTRKEMASA